MCEFCEKGQTIRSKQDDWSFYIRWIDGVPRFYVKSYYWKLAVPIFYCPWCGKMLISEDEYHQTMAEKK